MFGVVPSGGDGQVHQSSALGIPDVGLADALVRGGILHVSECTVREADLRPILVRWINMYSAILVNCHECRCHTALKSLRHSRQY